MQKKVGGSARAEKKIRRSVVAADPEKGSLTRYPPLGPS